MFPFWRSTKKNDMNLPRKRKICAWLKRIWRGEDKSTRICEQNVLMNSKTDFYSSQSMSNQFIVWSPMEEMQTSKQSTSWILSLKASCFRFARKTKVGNRCRSCLAVRKLSAHWVSFLRSTFSSLLPCIVWMKSMRRSITKMWRLLANISRRESVKEPKKLGKSRLLGLNQVKKR